MKTAIVISGVCRNTVISSLSWNFLPEADWYLTTWDKTQETYSNELYPSDNEISNIKERFNKIHIENYVKFIDNCQLDEISIINSRSYFLLKQLDVDFSKYDNVIYFRPDLFLKEHGIFKIEDVQLSNNQAKLVSFQGDEINLEEIINDNEKSMQDSFFIMTGKTFDDFSKNIFDFVTAQTNKTIHNIIYDWFHINHINVELLTTIQSGIVRKECIEFYDKNKQINLGDIVYIFGKVYEKFQFSSKYGKEFIIKEQ